ncbi:hypothetical protein DSO57_1017618 [Entomophthora muscae]|uniref:Uncharacterized protein n=1 Tax=Entomophthora muscae TaxID=34485 RepID=A0ACC2S6H0_9FUNG|nr:hypothetical protein DSO57_1017618 [Entomophthora muscae]
MTSHLQPLPKRSLWLSLTACLCFLSPSPGVKLGTQKNGPDELKCLSSPAVLQLLSMNTHPSGHASLALDGIHARTIKLMFLANSEVHNLILDPIFSSGIIIAPPKEILVGSIFSQLPEVVELHQKHQLLLRGTGIEPKTIPENNSLLKDGKGDSNLHHQLSGSAQPAKPHSSWLQPSWGHPGPQLCLQNIWGQMQPSPRVAATLGDKSGVQFKQLIYQFLMFPHIPLSLNCRSFLPDAIHDITQVLPMGAI